MAIAMSRSIAGRLIAMFLESAYMKDARQINCGFTSFDDALARLAELLPDRSATADSED